MTRARLAEVLSEMSLSPAGAVPPPVALERLGAVLAEALGDGEGGDGEGRDGEVLAALAGLTDACLRLTRANDELRASAERTRSEAMHDGLTGLPNRLLLADRLEQALARSRRSDRVTAVLFVDLDRFKRINDLYGHAVGDALLVAFAARVRSLLRPGDTAARLGGDEFVVLCEDLPHPGAAGAIAARLASALEEPFALDAATVVVTASIGVVTAGARHRSAAGLLDDADSAMYDAKRRGGRRFEVIDLRSGTADEPAVADELASAVRDGRLGAAYQPVVGTVDGRLAWAEASVHWDHPGGRLEGGEVARLAERHGLVADYGRAVMERALGDRAAWAAAGAGGDVAVEVATAHLLQPGFASVVAEVLEHTGTEPSAVLLELCEDVVVDFADRVAPVLERLSDLGVGLALDGFGTNRSALGSLAEHPFDAVKLDSRLVADLAEPATHARVFAITEMAHLLGVEVVAEGIDTDDDRRQAVLLGCDYSQGTLFGPAVPPEALAAAPARPR